jgi:hypothetical protein
VIQLRLQQFSTDKPHPDATMPKMQFGSALEIASWGDMVADIEIHGAVCLLLLRWPWADEYLAEGPMERLILLNWSTGEILVVCDPYCEI